MRYHCKSNLSKICSLRTAQGINYFINAELHPGAAKGSSTGRRTYPGHQRCQRIIRRTSTSTLPKIYPLAAELLPRDITDFINATRESSIFPSPYLRHQRPAEAIRDTSISLPEHQLHQDTADYPRTSMRSPKSRVSRSS